MMNSKEYVLGAGECPYPDLQDQWEFLLDLLPGVVSVTLPRHIWILIDAIMASPHHREAFVSAFEEVVIGLVLPQAGKFVAESKRRAILEYAKLKGGEGKDGKGLLDS